jgi:hypothetical protein
MTSVTILELDPRELGTLEFDGDQWVPYVDLEEEEPRFIPTHVRIGSEEYAYHSSSPIFGSGAELPQRIRELRSAGKKVLVIQRGASGSGGKNERYYLFASPA